MWHLPVFLLILFFFLCNLKQSFLFVRVIPKYLISSVTATPHISFGLNLLLKIKILLSSLLIFKQVQLLWSTNRFIILSAFYKDLTKINPSSAKNRTLILSISSTNPLLSFSISSMIWYVINLKSVVDVVQPHLIPLDTSIFIFLSQIMIFVQSQEYTFFNISIMFA